MPLAAAATGVEAEESVPATSATDSIAKALPRVGMGVDRFDEEFRPSDAEEEEVCEGCRERGAPNSVLTNSAGCDDTDNDDEDGQPSGVEMAAAPYDGCCWCCC